MDNQNQKENVEAIQHALNSLKFDNYRDMQRTEDILAMNIIQTLISGYAYLPLTSASFRPLCLAHMLNDIVVNSRKTILEFGAGMSTILIGRLIQKNNLQTKLLSIEHDSKWVAVLNRLIVHEGLNNIIQVKEVPLSVCRLALENNVWYDLNILEEAFRDSKFDMLIIDGPPAWEEGKRLVRFPALPFISDKLQPNYSIFLDDADREGEKQILRLWQQKYHLNFQIRGNKLAFFQGENAFCTDLFSY